MSPDSFRQLADHLPQPLLLLTPRGGVLAANRAARRALGGVAAGGDLGDLAADPAALRRYLALCARGEGDLPGGFRPRGADEPWRCDCGVLASPEPGEEVQLVLRLRRRSEATQRFLALNEQLAELHREVRRRQDVERERGVLLEQERQARTAAETANRLKDEFLATVSHELRTPLNAMKGWVSLLREAGAEGDLLRRGLDTIDRNIDVQTHLVEDILDMSRIIGGRVRLAVRPVDLAATVRDAVEAVRPAAEAKGVRLRALLDGGPSIVQGDRDRLLQVLWNLLSNAVKFTPKEGRVEVLLRRVNSHVEVAVTDTGEGIAPDVLPYVFDRFRQADATPTRHHGGLGLGLSIVRHLVELHGGLVTAESPGKGGGATFVVSLPVPLFQRPAAVAEPGDVAAEAAADAAADAPDRSLVGLSVLLVEDHDDSRELLGRILADAGAEVVPVGSATEAFTAWETSRPDVLVSDIELPGEDGYTLLRKLRDRERREGLRRTPAAAVTAYTTGEFRVRALRAGFQTFLAKPLDPRELLAAVASLAGRI